MLHFSLLRDKKRGEAEIRCRICDVNWKTTHVTGKLPACCLSNSQNSPSLVMCSMIGLMLVSLKTEEKLMGKINMKEMSMKKMKTKMLMMVMTNKRRMKNSNTE